METTKEFIFDREVNATVGLLFDVWTKAEHLEKWFGPAGFQIIVPKLKLVPGGTFHYCMKALTGDKMWGKFVYQEIIPNEKLQFVTSFSNAEEGFTRHPMSETWPIEVLSTVYFQEVNGKTILRMTASPINATDEECLTFESSYDLMTMGWSGTFTQLETYLVSIQYI